MPNKWLNSKKKAPNKPKKHLKRLRRSIDDASKGLRVLLDKASSSDLLFIKIRQNFKCVFKRDNESALGEGNRVTSLKIVGIWEKYHHQNLCSV